MGSTNKVFSQPAAEILHRCAVTFEERGALYGDNYKNAVGTVLQALFEKCDIDEMYSARDWCRVAMVVQIVIKLTRYCQQFEKGGHVDSAHDLAVYAAMLQELTEV